MASDGHVRYQILKNKVMCTTSDRTLYVCEISAFYLKPFWRYWVHKFPQEEKE